MEYGEGFEYLEDFESSGRSPSAHVINQTMGVQRSPATKFITAAVDKQGSNKILYGREI